MTSDSLEPSNPQNVDGKSSTTETNTADSHTPENANETQAPMTEETVEDVSHSAPFTIPNPLLNYEDAGLSPDLQQILSNAKWKMPRQLDGMAIPHALQGEDLVIQAASKTSAIVFLTLAHRLSQFKGKTSASEAPQALVLYSSTEAAQKGQADFLRIFGDTGLSASIVEDKGDSETEKEEGTETASANILFANPLDLKNANMKGLVSFKNVLVCICRDADRIQEGMSSDLDFVLSRVREAQKILFTSAISSSIQDLSSKFLKDAKQISLERERATIATVEHKAYLCETPNKFKVLLGTLNDQNPNCMIVFANSKLTGAWLFHKLQENGFAVEQVSSEIAPQKREELVQNVQSGKTKVLVATDYESRNFTFDEVSHVFNFDLPESGDAYLSRMGKVGKVGQGFVISLVCEEYGQNYQFVVDLLGQKAPKPVWAREEYLKIVDKSGNPFLEKNIFVEKRPARDFGDRPRRSFEDRDRSGGFQRKERHERPERDRSERSDRGERSDRMSRGPRIEERPERSERIEQRPERFDSERGDRHKQRGDRVIRSNDRDRDEARGAPPRSTPPQIKPRARRQAHVPGGQVRPAENQRRVIPREQKKEGVLKKILSFFFSKK